MMNNKEKFELAHWAISRARNYGADQAAVNISKNRNVEVDYRERRIERLQDSTESSLSLSIYANNRYSSHTTNDLDKVRLERFIEEAVAMTRLLGQDEYRQLPDPEYYQGRRDIDLELRDSSLDGISSDQRIDWASELEDMVYSQSDKIIACTSGYSDNLSESIKVHSNGFEGERTTTSFTLGADASVKDESGARPSGWDYRLTRFRKDMPPAELIARRAVKRAVGRLGQKKMDSGKYDMVVENRSAGRIVRLLYGPMRASSLQQKNSFLEGKLGEKIASEKFTIIDDPFIKSGLGSRLYDGEGLAAQRRVMIENGILKSYYVDSYYGRKLGMEPTTGSSSNLVVEPGAESMEDLVRKMKKGILVTGFIGGNSNSTTGDFSVGIYGVYVEDGETAGPVYEMNISGNLTELMDRLVEVGNDPNVYSSWRIPSLYFADVQFSGI